MNMTMLKLADACNRRKLQMTSVQVRTPDGRDWAIDRGRGGGFRLFELDLELRNGPEEHDAIDGDEWLLIGQLLDYLEAVGRRKDTPPPPSPAQLDPAT